MDTLLRMTTKRVEISDKVAYDSCSGDLGPDFLSKGAARQVAAGHHQVSEQGSWEQGAKSTKDWHVNCCKCEGPVVS